MTVLRALARYARDRPRDRLGDAPRCDLCAAEVGEPHDHVIDRVERALRCACRPCALLFDTPEATRYRTVPRRVLTASDAGVTDARWHALGIPIGLAFVFFNSAVERWVAVYPSPAGPVESEPAGDAWEVIARDSPLVSRMEPDVEALLVRTRFGGACECFVAPIDTCYQLVARVRRHWRGMDGGDQVRSAIDDFFSELRGRSRVVTEAVRTA